jgi:hypothetical protein
MACAGAEDSRLAVAEPPSAVHPVYRWLAETVEDSLQQRVPPPEGYRREPIPAHAYGTWLRGLPLKPGRPPVHLYDGNLKANQDAHHAVIDIDPGEHDLQQCADAVMRLRAEYMFSRGCDSEIRFDFTSGDVARWIDWREGDRPEVSGNHVTWGRTATPDDGYRNFRRYLDVVFTYAGSASLSRELTLVEDPSSPEIGDVFIEGGFPGHAVLVVDVAVNEDGERVFLLAQSYMPAQEIHLLRSPEEDIDPWYRARASGILETPEWEFRYKDLKRFSPVDCLAGSTGSEEVRR